MASLIVERVGRKRKAAAPLDTDAAAPAPTLRKRDGGASASASASASAPTSASAASDVGSKRPRAPRPPPAAAAAAAAERKKRKAEEAAEEEDERQERDDPVALVAARRAALVEKTSAAEVAALAAVEAEAAACRGKRWLVRRAAELAARAAELRATIAAIDRGDHVADFDRKVAPYLERFRALAAARRAYVASAGKAGRVRHTGGGLVLVGASGAPAAAAAAVRQAPTSSAPDARQAVVDALRADVLGEAPPLYLSFGDICDDCGVAMRVIANCSMLACPTCAKTRVLPNMTSAAVTHGTDMDYSSNTWHQKNTLVEMLEYKQAKESPEPVADILAVTLEFMWRYKRTPLVEYADAIAAEEDARGPFADADDAVARLRDVVPDIEGHLRRLTGNKVLRCVREIAAAAETWLYYVQPEAAALSGRARTAAIEKFQDHVRKYYGRSPKTAAYIGGYLPLQLRSDQEEYIRRLFIAAVPAYDKFRKKPGTNNWPGGYAFFIRSVLILLGLDEHVYAFPLPTGAKNLRDRETMRQAICKEMDWEYVPSSLPLPPLALPQGAALSPYLVEDGADEEPRQPKRSRKDKK